MYSLRSHFCIIRGSTHFVSESRTRMGVIASICRVPIELRARNVSAKVLAEESGYREAAGSVTESAMALPSLAPPTDAGVASVLHEQANVMSLPWSPPVAAAMC